VLAVDTINSTGPANAGAVTYYLNSDETLNPDYPATSGHHIYSTSFSGGIPPTQGSFTSTFIPAGTYVAFEDILLNDPNRVSDLDYNDHQFVFTGVTASVPDGGMTLTLLGMALTGLAFVRRKF
jgi:hypothetical protein